MAEPRDAKVTLELSEEQCSEGGASPARSAASPERVRVTRRTTLLGMESWTVERSERLWRVFHTSYAFCSLRRMDPGRQHWTYRRRDYDMDYSSVMLLEPGEMHVTRKLPRADFDVLFLDADLVQDPESAGPLHFLTGQLQDQRISRVLLALTASVAGDAGDLEIEERCSTFRRLVARRAGDQPARVARACQRAVRRAREYVHANYSRRLTLAGISAAAGVSPFHLERSFGECTGLPLHRYLTEVRLGHARALIRVGLPLAKAASMTGFCDAPHLTRVFRAELGITPGYYARARVR